MKYEVGIQNGKVMEILPFSFKKKKDAKAWKHEFDLLNTGRKSKVYKRISGKLVPFEEVYNEN